jgi:hypothetical protein
MADVSPDIVRTPSPLQRTGTLPSELTDDAGEAMGSPLELPDELDGLAAAGERSLGSLDCSDISEAACVVYLNGPALECASLHTSAAHALLLT